MIFQPFTSTEIPLPVKPAVGESESDRMPAQQQTTTPTRGGVARSLIGVLLVVLAIRAIVLMTGIAAFHSAPATSWYASDRPWLAWDALHYLDILDRGYAAPRFAGDVPDAVAFFPLLPALAWPLTCFMPAGTALVVVANFFSIVAASLIYLWAREIGGPRVAWTCCLLTMAYPCAVFFSAGYTEAPFLCATASVLLLVQRKQLVAAAVVCGLATGLRPTGGALVVYVGANALGAWGHLLAKQCRSFRIDMTDRSHVLHTLFAGGLKLLLIGVLSVSGLLMYQSFLVGRYQRTDAYFAAQKAWETPNPQMSREFASRYNPLVPANGLDEDPSGAAANPSVLTRLFTPGAVNRLLWMGVMAFCLWGFIAPGPIPRTAFLIPLVIFLLGYVPGWGARSSSTARFMTAAVPCFCLMAIHLSQPKSRRIGGIAIIGMVAVQLGYAWAFSRGLWTG